MARDSEGKLAECGSKIVLVNDINYGANKFLRP